MSTRWIIAEPYGDGFRGRYVHSDGYPSGALPELARVIDDVCGGDVRKALDVLTVQNYGWSHIDKRGYFDSAGYKDSRRKDKRFKEVREVGLAYTDTVIPGLAIGGGDYQQITEDAWYGWGWKGAATNDTEWAYVIDEPAQRVTVFQCHWDDPPTFCRSFSLDDLREFVAANPLTDEALDHDTLYEQFVGVAREDA